MNCLCLEPLKRTDIKTHQSKKVEFKIHPNSESNDIPEEKFAMIFWDFSASVKLHGLLVSLVCLPVNSYTCKSVKGII